MSGKVLVKKIVCAILSVVMMGSCVSALDKKDIGDEIACESIKVRSGDNNSNVYNSEFLTRRCASRMACNIYKRYDGDIEVVEYKDKKIHIDKYKNDKFKLISSQVIECDLPCFGGFYNGSEYNFLIVGQLNEGMDDKLTTVRVIKYSKDWERLGHVDYANNNTVAPFDFGTVSFAEHDGYLYVHTCHKMYSGHQANMSFSVNIEKMSIADETSAVSYKTFAYVSHSFSQKIQIDGDRLVAVDLGDAYPRAVVITKLGYDLVDGQFVTHSDKEYFDGKVGVKKNIFEIPGKLGANCTGVFVGGFEVTKDKYLVTLSTIDHSKVTEYTSISIDGLQKEERDVYVYAVDKDYDVDSSATIKSIKLTEYIDNNKTCGDPYLVKISNDRLAVLWEEFEIKTDTYGFHTWYYDRQKSNGVKYCIIDSQGNKISSIKSIDKAVLGFNCQPVYVDGNIMWYVNNEFGQRTIYRLNVGEWSSNTLNFSDIHTYDTNYNAIKFVCDEGLFQGTSDTTFEPEATMTREMFVTVLGRHAGVDTSKYTQNKFKDVESDSWYAPYVEWASKTGIVQGYGNGLYGIGDKITIEQAVVILGRYVNKIDYGTGKLEKYMDAKEVSDWAYDYMRWSVNSKIYKTKDSYLRPKDNASRALIASMIYNLETNS